MATLTNRDMVRSYLQVRDKFVEQAWHMMCGKCQQDIRDQLDWANEYQRFEHKFDEVVNGH